MTVEMRYDARPSTVPRRQGRQGRAFDFAQWYPRVVVYDRYGWEEHPLYPAGEFYGEFGTFKVQLDVPEDQVVGATGVPICGDPGWERANQDPSQPVEYQRDYYGSAAAFFVHTRTENGVTRTDCSFAPGGNPPGPRPQDRSSGTPPTCTTSPCPCGPTTGTRAAITATSPCTCSTSRATSGAGAAGSP